MNRLIVSAFLSTGLLAVVGCDDGPGGAYQATTVTILPPDLGGASDAAAATEGGTESAAAPSTGGGPGTFRGRVILTGGSPSLPPLITQGANVKDAEVCSAQPVPNEKLVLGEDNGVANVFIYIKKVPSGTPDIEVPDEPLIFDQKGCRFLPHCLIVPVGQTVKVLSGDAVAHNTHTYPQRNTGVSQTVPANDRVGQLEVVYRAAERDPLQVTCDFHTWMKAWHFPVDHPFVALTDSNGNFTIENLPAGSHTFTVWHESADGNYVDRNLKVTIRPGETTEQDIQYPVSLLEL